MLGNEDFICTDPWCNCPHKAEKPSDLQAIPLTAQDYAKDFKVEKALWWDICECKKEPGTIFWIDNPRTMIHETCGKKVCL